MSRPIGALILAITISASIVAADNATCYNLFGQADESLRPCDPSAAVSSCCRNDDICLSSGLCMSTANSWAGFIWANGCTDATHKDAACPSQCTSQTSIEASSSFNVLQCTFPFSNATEQRDAQWCCRSATNYDNCCSDSTLTFNDTQQIGLFLTPGSTKAINPADAYIPAADCASSSSSNSTNSTSALNADQSCPANHTAAVGGAVGGVLGALLLGALAAIFFLLRNRKALRSQVSAVSTQRDEAVHKASNEKTLLAQLQAQQQYTPGSMSQPDPMMGYQQSNAFGQSPQGMGHGGGHIYNQYSAGASPATSPPAEIGHGGYAEMNATKYAEMDASTPHEMSVTEVQPTPGVSSHGGGSVRSKVSG